MPRPTPVLIDNTLVGCVRTWGAVVTKAVGTPVVPKGSTAVGFAGDTRAKVAQQIADAVANKQWPERSLRPVRFLDCRGAEAYLRGAARSK